MRSALYVIVATFHLFLLSDAVAVEDNREGDAPNNHLHSHGRSTLGCRRLRRKPNH